MKQPLCLLNPFKILFTSVVVSLCLCKTAFADDLASEKSFWDGFHFGGYSSAGITFHSDGDTEAALNEISLILSWQSNSRFRFFSELELERPLIWRESEHIRADSSYLDLERLYLDYNISEKANLRAGRFLTPVGRWNLLHAAPLVWTTTRPLATSRLFPISTNGAMLFGAIPLENYGLEYSVFIEAVKDQHRDGDETLFKDIYGGRLELTGNTDIGISILEFKERITNTPQFKMVGLDFLTHYKSWEFSGEAFQRFYTNGNDGGSGGYVQTVAPLGNQWYAIARLETFQRPEEGSSERWLLGTAWKLAPNRILKMEVTGGDEERSKSPKGFLASFAILF